MNAADIRALRPLITPTVLAGAFTFLVDDPTYRFPLIVLVLPMFLRGAARVLGVAKDATDTSKVGRAFAVLGFLGFVVGWLLMFAILGFTVAVGLFSGTETGNVLRASITVAAGGFIVAAWYWWPWYARDELAAWPRHGVRVWASSSNRWDRLLLSWRMQQLAASGDLRWRGFGATAALVATVFVLAAFGTYSGIGPRMLEVAGVLLLPVLHVGIAKYAHALCLKWQRGKPTTPEAEADRAGAGESRE